MRVTLATCGFPDSPGRIVGGVAGVTYYLATGLSRIPGVEVEVVTLASDRGHQALSESRSNDGWLIRSVRARSGLRFYYDIARRVPNIVSGMVNRSRADIVHVQNEASWALRIRKPCLFTIHGINELDTLHRGHPVWARARSAVVSRIEGRARRRVRNVVCINPYVRRFLGTDQRVWEIENPVADSYFEVARNPRKAVILCAASVIPLKNIHGLIEAFAAVNRVLEGAELRIAGNGLDSKYGRECVEQSRRLGVDARVNFLGGVGLDQLQRELAQASLLALTSFRETAPLSISEAMAAGVPVLAPDVGGVPALVEEGVTGRLVSPHDPTRIAAAILRMLTADDLRSMGATAKARAERRFRAANVAEKTLEAYEQILGERPATGRETGNLESRELQWQ